MFTTVNPSLPKRALGRFFGGSSFVAKTPNPFNTGHQDLDFQWSSRCQWGAFACGRSFQPGTTGFELSVSLTVRPRRSAVFLPLVWSGEAQNWAFWFTVKLQKVRHLPSLDSEFLLLMGMNLQQSNVADVPQIEHFDDIHRRNNLYMVTNEMHNEILRETCKNVYQFPFLTSARIRSKDVQNRKGDICSSHIN